MAPVSVICYFSALRHGLKHKINSLNNLTGNFKTSVTYDCSLLIHVLNGVSKAMFLPSMQQNIDRERAKGRYTTHTHILDACASTAEEL